MANLGIISTSEENHIWLTDNNNGEIHNENTI